MNRLLALFVALGLGLWAQRILTGPRPGIPRDALILFVLAGILFTWNAQTPRALRSRGPTLARSWRRWGMVLTGLGLAVGLIALVVLWLDLTSVLGLLLWPISTVLFLVGTFLETDSPGVDQGEPVIQPQPANRADPSSTTRGDSLSAWVSAHWHLLLLGVILAVATFLRFYQLDVYPNGCQSDECNNGLDALRWLTGTRYQPYVETNEGQATLFTYLIALAFRLAGVGVTQMRYVPALAGVLTVLVFYLLADQLYGRKPALAATALLATARWHITFSRIVYELIMQPFFLILLFLFLIRALRTGRRREWALAGIALAAGLNTYTAFRVVPLLLIAFLLFWIGRTRLRERHRLRHDLQGMALLAGAALTALLPLGIYILQHWRIYTARIRHISVWEDVEQVGSIQPIVENLRKTLYMFNLQGDSAALNNLPGSPMLDTLVGLFFVLGLAYSAWYMLRGRSLPVLYGMWFVAIASLAVLSVAHEAPSARRTIGMIPLIYLLVALVIDQLLLAWSSVWGSAGQRAFAYGMAALVVFVAFVNVRTYFTVQATHPAVWNAYSPVESAVGDFLKTVPEDVTVLISPQLQHHSAIRLAARERSYHALDPAADLPYRARSSGDLLYVLEVVDQPLLSLLQQIYPTGEGQQYTDRFNRPLFIAFQVPQSDLAETLGLVGEYYSSYPPTQAAEVVQAVQALDLDMSQAPLDPPYYAIWQGSLLVPEFGDYTFDVLAEGAATALEIGANHRLDVTADNQGVLTATLAAGLQPFRLEYRSGEVPGRLQVTWSGPEGREQVLGGRSLYAFDIGNQGLVGYYYPNPDWAGPPSLVRNDPLVLPNNPLPEPFSIRWRGKLYIPQTGTYVLGTRSDDGSFVFLDGQLVVDNGGNHGARDRQGSVYLEEGFHELEVRYNQYVGARELDLWWQPPGQGRASIDSRYLFPFEGDAIPEDLILPPPPQIARGARVPEEDAGLVAPGGISGETGDSGLEGTTRPVQGMAPVAATVAWNWGSCGSGPDQLQGPRGVAVDPETGRVLVADTGNLRVVVLDSAGQRLRSWGEGGEGPEQFQEPVDLAFEPGGTILVLDALGQRLLRFDGDGQFLEAFGADLALYRPRGMGLDLAGQIAVADTGGSRIVQLEPDGTLRGQVGGPDSELGQQQPTDVALTAGGTLYFVEAESGVLTRLESGGVRESWTVLKRSSTIDGPHLALTGTGRLLLTDPEGQQVLVFERDGQPVGYLAPSVDLQKPVGIAAGSFEDGEELVVVVDSQACRVVAFQLGS